MLCCMLCAYVILLLLKSAYTAITNITLLATPLTPSHEHDSISIITPLHEHDMETRTLPTLTPID